LVLSNCVKILFIGDIFGRPGRTIVRDKLKDLVREYSIDLVLANGENAAAGFGITPTLAEDLFELGIDGVNVCAAIEQDLQRVRIAGAGGGHECRFAGRIFRIRIGTGIQELLDDDGIAVDAGQIERSYAVSISGFGIGAIVQEFVDGREIVGANRPVKWSCAVRVARAFFSFLPFSEKG